jgi:hypothetical protein
MKSECDLAVAAKSQRLCSPGLQAPRRSRSNSIGEPMDTLFTPCPRDRAVADGWLQLALQLDNPCVLTACNRLHWGHAACPPCFRRLSVTTLIELSCSASSQPLRCLPCSVQVLPRALVCQYAAHPASLLPSSATRTSGAPSQMSADCTGEQARVCVSPRRVLTCAQVRPYLTTYDDLCADVPFQPSTQTSAALACVYLSTFNTHSWVRVLSGACNSRVFTHENHAIQPY